MSWIKICSEFTLQTQIFTQKYRSWLRFYSEFLRKKLAAGGSDHYIVPADTLLCIVQIWTTFYMTPKYKDFNQDDSSAIIFSLNIFAGSLLWCLSWKKEIISKDVRLDAGYILEGILECHSLV